MGGRGQGWEGESLRSQVRRSSDLIGELSITGSPGAEARNKGNKDGRQRESPLPPNFNSTSFFWGIAGAPHN